MPRLIDHTERATIITEAAWRVLVRDGVKAVSVRNVAEEAGIATASLRRAFPTQADLLAACLTLMGTRVEERIAGIRQTGDPVDTALAVLAETLPLDTERRIEMEVYVTLGTTALSDKHLQRAYTDIDEGLHELCSLVVHGLRDDELAPPTETARRDPDVVHLHALLDGLALHMLHGLPPSDALDILRTHLRTLAA